GFEMTYGLPSVRMTATLDATAVDAFRPSVVVTERLAELLELETGDLLVLTLSDVVGNLDTMVTGITPAIPGAASDSAVLLDLAMINHLHQRSDASAPALTGVWVASDDTEAASNEIRAFLPASARIQSSTDPVGRQVLGAAAIA